MLSATDGFRPRRFGLGDRRRLSNRCDKARDAHAASLNSFRKPLTWQCHRDCLARPRIAMRTRREPPLSGTNSFADSPLARAASTSRWMKSTALWRLLGSRSYEKRAIYISPSSLPEWLQSISKLQGPRSVASEQGKQNIRGPHGPERTRSLLRRARLSRPR